MRHFILVLILSGCGALREDLGPDASAGPGAVSPAPSSQRDALPDLDVASSSMSGTPDAPAAFDTLPPIDLVPPMSDASNADGRGPCDQVCLLGNRRCTGREVQTCVVGANGCSTWGTSTACPSPQACVEGVCACPPECPSAGSKDCGPSGGLRTCMQEGPCRMWSSETACSTANGTSACENGNCALRTCATRFHKCGNECASDADANACGPDCRKCPGAENATSTCEANLCGTVCNRGAVRCSDGLCARSSWDFEDGRTGGFQSVIAGAVTVSNQGHNSQRAISTEETLPGSGRAAFLVNKSEVCAASSVFDDMSRTASAWLFLSGPINEADSTCRVLSSFSDGTPVNARKNQWFRASLAPVGKVNGLFISCDLDVPTGGTVTLLIDDVAVE
jgi:hypothetical protein